MLVKQRYAIISFLFVFILIVLFYSYSSSDLSEGFGFGSLRSDDQKAYSNINDNDNDDDDDDNDDDNDDDDHASKVAAARRRRIASSNSIIPLYIYLHVPKAAGSTMENLLSNYVLPAYAPAQAPAMCKNNCNFLALSEEAQNQHYIIAGHRGYGVHLQPGFKVYLQKDLGEESKYPVRRLQYITILRHPVERVISQFYYAKDRFEEKQKAFEAQRLAGELDPDAHVYYDDNTDTYQLLNTTFPSFRDWFFGMRNKQNSPWNAAANPMTFQFSHYWSPPRMARADQRQERSDPSLTDSLHRDMLKSDLEAAKRHLTSFAAIGLAERMLETIQLFYYNFGWKLPLHPPILNRKGHYAEKDGLEPVTSISPEEEMILASNFNQITLDDRKLIERWSILDLELYQFATLLFDEFVAAFRERQQETTKKRQS